MKSLYCIMRKADYSAIRETCLKARLVSAHLAVSNAIVQERGHFVLLSWEDSAPNWANAVEDRLAELRERVGLQMDFLSIWADGWYDTSWEDLETGLLSMPAAS